MAKGLGKSRESEGAETPRKSRGLRPRGAPHTTRFRYGRIDGCAKAIKDEVRGVLALLEDSKAGKHFLYEKGHHPDNNGPKGILHCKPVSNLLLNLRRDYFRRQEDKAVGTGMVVSERKGLFGSIESVSARDCPVAERLEKLRNHFRAVLNEYTPRMRDDACDFAGVECILNEMESSDPVVLPDLEIIKIGMVHCRTWKHFESLQRRMMRLGITPDVEFLNQWLLYCGNYTQVIGVLGRLSAVGNATRGTYENFVTILSRDGFRAADYASIKNYLTRICDGNRSSAVFWRQMLDFVSVIVSRNDQNGRAASPVARRDEGSIHPGFSVGEKKGVGRGKRGVDPEVVVVGRENGDSEEEAGSTMPTSPVTPDGIHVGDSSLGDIPKKRRTPGRRRGGRKGKNNI